MALNKVEICGVNTSKLPVLKAEEKEELFRRIKEGDEEARELYIKGNLRLVLSVIKRFSNSSENMDDLFQIGCIGLIKAIDNFDTTLNVKFSTYAVPMIIGEIRRYLRDNNSIRVSRSLRDIAYRAIYAKETYMKTNLREPTIAEIASEIGINKEMIVLPVISVYETALPDLSLHAFLLLPLFRSSKSFLVFSHSPMICISVRQHFLIKFFQKICDFNLLVQDKPRIL